MKRISLASTLTLLLLFTNFVQTQTKGKIYFVLGSDTAIWEGMGVDRYHDTYNITLYTDPSRNGYAVMEPSFRNAMTDYFGTPMKLTWWMMCGNIFRYATNTNMPIPNIMTMYLMKKYHEDAIQQFGDELTLHYHTFTWTDYDGDGKYWWNQAHQFAECREDFDVTLAQLLLEENEFPVSFRSGWHAMDNGWQAYLDELLPYSMHNDWPAVRADTIEPIDNVFDWSQASGDFIPFHPSAQNYQLPGDDKGWNVRSKHIGSVTASMVTDIFTKADQGSDEVVCFWGHLPETDFLTNVQKVDSLIHFVAASYPSIEYRYCTAIEAMQRWRQGADTTAPSLTLQEEVAGDNVNFSVTTDEPIFQAHPFIAIKDVYERYRVIPCTSSGGLTWTTTESVQRSILAKVGCAVTDTMGNLATAFISYLPDDIFTDDEDAGYTEPRGTWGPASTSSWGTSARVALVAPGDTAIVRWALLVSADTLYNLFVQVPSVSDPVTHLMYRILRNGTPGDSVVFDHALTPNAWIFAGTASLRVSENPALELIAVGEGASAQNVAADVVRCTPLVREKELVLSTEFLDFGSVGIDDTATAVLNVQNVGVQPLTIHGVSTSQPSVTVVGTFPLLVPAMGSAQITLRLHSEIIGSLTDTLHVTSDDPINPETAVVFNAAILMPFRVADNEDAALYHEVGTWYYSNAQAYGPTSRYAFLSDGSGNHATFTITAPRSGYYDVMEIVPTTVNASDNALYVIKTGATPVDSVFLDQNAGSGDWVVVGHYFFSAGDVVEISVMNTGQYTVGAVLRADAMKLQLVEEAASGIPSVASTVPAETGLLQNYPNPFNPTTTIPFTLREASEVSLRVYDMMGRLVRTLITGQNYPAGFHRVPFDASDLPSGVYICRLTAGPLQTARKMILMK